MSDDVVIKAEHLGKRYRLGQTLDLTRSFRETLTTLPRFVERRMRDWLRPSDDGAARTPGAEAADPDTPPGTFWALRDLDFEVRRGEVIGVIGRNGAGKSTLLKILSRITYPTAGEAETVGRVASLLEVGTGFHVELSGRENIYLNGAILGMKKAEIDRKFDEIVEFAEVERFLDTPVKRYSSGMHVRLAFAVAAHLEPDILIVDEVLAVGDAAFQKKCLGKMDAVASGGRTVLFVSHNMSAIETLCQRALLLDRGRLIQDGPTDAVIRRYLATSAFGSAVTDAREHPGRKPDSTPVITRTRLLNGRGEESAAFQTGEDVAIEIDVDPAGRPLRYPSVILLITSHLNQPMATLATSGQVESEWEISAPRTVRCVWPDCRLAPGQYHVTVIVRNGVARVDRIDQATGFEITATSGQSFGRRLPPGLIAPRVRWEI